ncbi:hypothetical protein [Nocardia barduliensis]|uniref:hypothetical protein n=1 Tax=Nocardia barduliensis TaxID=2736643 RepID=UPI00157365D6|nr:hypothetical protein [Nocardia barduliensis]
MALSPFINTGLPSTERMSVDAEYTIERLVVWAVLGWAFAAAYQDAMSTGGRRAWILAVLIGVTLGWLGSLSAGVAGGGAMLVAGAEASAVATWCIPLVVAWLARWMNIYGRALFLYRSYDERRSGMPGGFPAEPSIGLTSAAGVVGVVALTLPPGPPLGTFVLAVGCAAMWVFFSGWFSVLGYLSSPTIGRGRVRRFGGIIGWRALLVAAAVQVAALLPEAVSPHVSVLAMCWVHVYFSGRFRAQLTRYRRHEADLSAIATVLVAGLLASGPVGRGITDFFERASAIAVASVFAVCVVAVLIWLRAAHVSGMRYRDHVIPARFRLRVVFASGYPVAWFLPWLVVLAADQRQLDGTALRAVAAVALLAVAFRVQCGQSLLLAMSRFDAVVFGRTHAPWWDAGRREAAWRRDAASQNPRLHLVLSMGQECRQISRGLPTLPGFPATRSLLRGELTAGHVGIDWSDHALSLLASAAEDHPGIERRWQYQFAAAICHLAAAEMFDALGYHENATLEYGQAADACAAGELVNLEAYCRIHESASLVDRTPRCAERMERLDHDPTVAPILRKELAAELIRDDLEAGRRDEAAQSLASLAPVATAPISRARRRDNHEMVYQYNDRVVITIDVGYRPITFEWDERRSTRLLFRGDLSAPEEDAFSRLPPRYLPDIFNGADQFFSFTPLIRRAFTALRQDRIDDGIATLQRCVALAEAGQLLPLAAELWVEIAELERDRAPESSVIALYEACENWGLIRSRYSGVEQRMALARALEKLHANLIRSAARVGAIEIADSGMDGAAFALEAMERTRSRSLVDQLGTGFPMPPHDASSSASPGDEAAQVDLAEAFRTHLQAERKLARLRDGLREFDLFDPRRRAEALRELPKAQLDLDAARAALFTFGGAAAEYVALRRGDTLRFEQVKELLR